MSNKPSNIGGNGRNGHDSRGRFKAGNPGGPGRGRGLGRQYREALLGAVSAADIASITKKIVKDAKGGDLRAAELILSYSVGKPSIATSQETEEMAAAFTAAAEIVFRAVRPFLTQDQMSDVRRAVSEGLSSIRERAT